MEEGGEDIARLTRVVEVEVVNFQLVQAEMARLRYLGAPLDYLTLVLEYVQTQLHR
jgi:hypothetical protein